MIRLKRILSHFNVVVANYDGSKDYRMVLYRCRYKMGAVEFGPGEEKTEPDRSWNTSPLLLYICGYGVINKPAEQADQIVADKEKFIFSKQRDGYVCFVRKSQIEPLLERLGNSLLHIECVGDGADIVALGKDYYASNISWKNLLRPDLFGSRMSIQLYKKVKLFVLIVVLGILSINFAVRGAIDKKYAESHTLLTALQTEKGRQNELSKQEQDILKEFSNGINSGFARLGDHIGAAVPESVTLRNLAIQPPVKRIEQGKPFEVQASKVVIKGKSPDTAGISLFASRLREVQRVRDLKISSVEQSRDGQSLDFVIEMEL